MINLFIADSVPLENEETFGRYLEEVSSERQAKVEALVPRQKQNESLAAGVLLPLAFRACGIEGRIDIEEGDLGKPRIARPKGLFFNVSHSGGYALLALADCEVGCDIQCVKQTDPRLARRYFAPEEADVIENAGDNADELFCRYWTVKESYLKAIGCGLSRALNSFTVRFTDGGVQIDDPLGNGRWRVKEFSAPTGFKIACCAAGDDFPDSVRELKLNL